MEDKEEEEEKDEEEEKNEERKRGEEGAEKVNGEGVRKCRRRQEAEMEEVEREDGEEMFE